MKRTLIITVISLFLFSLSSFGTKERWDANKTNWSDLMLAVHGGDIEKVKQLITEGADINYLINDGYYAYNAIIVGVKTENYEIVKLLINNGADIKSTYNGDTLLMIASGYKNTDIIKILLKHGLDVNAHKKNGYTPLKAAVGSGSVQVMQILIDNGADVNYQNGGTALMFAAMDGNLEKIKVLLKAGAIKNIKTEGSGTAYNYNERAMEYTDSETEIKNRKIISELLKTNDNSGN